MPPPHPVARNNDDTVTDYRQLRPPALVNALVGAPSASLGEVEADFCEAQATEEFVQLSDELRAQRQVTTAKRDAWQHTQDRLIAEWSRRPPGHPPVQAPGSGRRLQLRYVRRPPALWAGWEQSLAAFWNGLTSLERDATGEELVVRVGDFLKARRELAVQQKPQIFEVKDEASDDHAATRGGSKRQRMADLLR